MGIRQIAATLAALVLCGCISWPQAWRVEPWSQAIGDDIHPFGEVEFTLKNGRVERVRNVSDHGYAMCGEEACFHKEDIASVGYRPQRSDALRTAAGVTMAAPALVVLGALCMINCDFDGGGDGKLTGQETLATREQLQRAWLDDLAIRDGRVVGKDLQPNPCVGDKPTAIGRDFATDIEAYRWIMANLNAVSVECLGHGFGGSPAIARTIPQEQLRLDTIRLAATLQVRWAWNYSRCVSTTHTDYLIRRAENRLTPSPGFVYGDNRGRPDALRVLEQTLADPASYENESDLPRVCKDGVLPRDNWPDLQKWIGGRSPFALPPGV